MLIIGHEQCYQKLSAILESYERAGYTHYVQVGQGESVLFDSNPAPGYVPGVLGKKDTGVEYVPRVDGTRLHIYYIAKDKADKRAIKEAQRAISSGFDAREILGSLVSIKRTKAGGIQLQFVASNRDVIVDGRITAGIALRSVSVTADGAENSGLIVALGLDQSLGMPYHQLKQMAASLELRGQTPAAAAQTISARVRQAAAGIPTPAAEAAEVDAPQVVEGGK